MELKEIFLLSAAIIIWTIMLKLISMHGWYNKSNMYLLMYVISFPLISYLIMKIII